MSLPQKRFTHFFEKFFLSTGYPCFWIAITVCLVYMKTAAFQFTCYDDSILIVDNQYALLPGLKNIIFAFMKPLGARFEDFYRPLLQLSFMSDSFIGGARPVIYHLSNVIYHALASSLLYLLLQKLHVKSWVSFCYALIFAVHPVLVSAVAWIPGRNDSLLGIFVLLSFLFLIEYCDRGKTKHYLLHLLFLGMALFTKETAPVVVFLFAGYVFFFLERVTFRRSIVNLLFGWGMMGACWALMRFFAMKSSGVSLAGMGESLPYMVSAVVVYVGKMVLPVSLFVLPSVTTRGVLIGAGALLLLAAWFTFMPKEQVKRASFGFLWMLLFLLPPLLFMTSVYIPEHRAYVPLMGLFIMLPRDYSLDSPVKRSLFTIIAVSFFLCFVIGSFGFSDRFMNRSSFWQSAIRSSQGSYIAQDGMGSVYMARGDDRKAELCFLKAIEINPRYEGSYINLGNLYADRGENDKALQAYREAMRINGKSAIARFNIGEIYRKMNRCDQAIACYNEAISLDAIYFDARNNLGTIYMGQKRFDEAAEQFRKIIEVNPQYKGAFRNLEFLSKETRKTP